MIELHIFTNSTALHSPSTGLIERAAESFAVTFGQVGTTVWCDRRPNEQKAPEYLAVLRALFPKVLQSDSLSDGYLRAVQGSSSDYLFMLEHDWEFLDLPITLEDICVQMDESELTHLRFNKRTNRAVNWDKWLKQEQGSRLAFCRTPCVSNNPHVIHRRRYLDTAMPYVRHLPGARGLEERLSNRSIAAAIYGRMGLAPTIRHLDGRCGWRPSVAMYRREHPVNGVPGVPDESAILDHAEAPYHRGRAARPTCVHAERNAACGDWVRLELVLGPGERVAQAWFEGRGCVISQAAASILCQAVEGKTIGELRDLTAQQMLQWVEIPLTPRRMQCGLLAFKVLKTMVYSLDSTVRPEER